MIALLSYEWAALTAFALAVLAAILVYLSHQRMGKHDPVDWYEEPRIISDWDELVRAAQALGPQVRAQNDWIFRFFERKYPNVVCTKCGSKFILAYYTHWTIPPHGTTGYAICCPQCHCEFGRIHVLTI